jgi:GNAT superfamily N-acetyltransferase
MSVLPWSSGSVPTGSALAIRQAKGIDAPAIAELRALSSDVTRPTELFASSVRIWLETEGEARITLLASGAGRPVGMVSMLEYRSMPLPSERTQRWGYIDHLFVRDGYRRQGIATALVGELLAIADRREYPRLLASPSAAALSLFDRLGFRVLEQLGPQGIMLLRPGPGATAGQRLPPA